MIIISVDLGLTGYISVLKTFDNSINLESKYKIIVKTKNIFVKLGMMPKHYL